MRSSRRPGQATRIVDAAPQRAPSVLRSRRRRRRWRRAAVAPRASGASTAATCAASSRVGTSTSAVGRVRRRLGDLVGDDEPEGEGLARAGGCASADVASGEAVNQRGGLDRERRIDALGRARCSGLRARRVMQRWYEAKRTPDIRWDFYGPQMAGREGPHRLTVDDRRHKPNGMCPQYHRCRSSV